jgi:hypothetical protein
MSSISDLRRDDIVAGASLPQEANASSVAWAAIFGGALTAVAISLALLILGSALGLSTVSPWSRPDTIASFTVKTAIWLIVMQWIASAVGGYLTGRLRTRWAGVHGDEVFFRDTAHGFLAWAVATLLTASVMASAVSAVVGGGLHAATAVAAGAAAGGSQGAVQKAESDSADPLTAYSIDGLFRPASPNAAATTQDVRAETTRILALGVKNGAVPENDKAYLASLVAARTGLDEAEAKQRVDDTIAAMNEAKEKAKQDAEAARKAAMHASLYIFLSLLIGAFIASSAATVGGRHRDE